MYAVSDTMSIGCHPLTQCTELKLVCQITVWIYLLNILWLIETIPFKSEWDFPLWLGIINRYFFLDPTVAGTVFVGHSGIIAAAVDLCWEQYSVVHWLLWFIVIYETVGTALYLQFPQVRHVGAT